jgi:hypothetical protein
MAAVPHETPEEVLERWLADVRKGKICRIAIAGVCADENGKEHSITATASTGMGSAMLVAATALLHHRILRLVETCESESWKM